MANVKVAMSKKGMLIALVIGVLLLGGGGGYLLWRVNQQDTVAPTDSDASGGGSCSYRCTGNQSGWKNCNEVKNNESYIGCGSIAGKSMCHNEWERTCSYTLTYLAGEGGALDGTTTQTVKMTSWETGETRGPSPAPTAVTAKPNSGYKFVKWSDGKTTAARTDSDVNADATYTATFEKTSTPDPAKYTLTGSISPSGIDGSVVISGGEKAEPETIASSSGNKTTSVTQGERYTFKATAPEGYEFVKWTKNTGGGVVDFEEDPNQNPTTRGFTGNITVIANFKKSDSPAAKYTLTGSISPSGIGGSVVISGGDKATPETIASSSGNGTTSVTQGQRYTFKATAPAGYEFVKWTKNIGGGVVDFEEDPGVNPAANRGFTGNVTVIANFAKSSATDPVDCTGFQLTCGAGNTININWNLVSGSTRYVARVNKAPKDDWVNKEGGDEWVPLASNVNSYVVENVGAGVVYGVNVMAYNGSGDEDFHPSCNMTGLGQVWDPPLYKEISCNGDGTGGTGGTVPNTAIFEDTKDTIIFGIVVLMIGIGWTWLSTLPKRAYLSISKASAETKAAREKDIRESRRNRLERKLK